MTKTIVDFTLSLDGFIAGPDDNVGPLFKWYYSGDTDFPVAGTDMIFKMSRASADFMQAAWANIGALVTGRRDFDVSHAWGGNSPLGVPIFIVTHHPPAEWENRESPFTFVTAGVSNAIEQARAIAGAKNVAVSGSQIVQQSLALGLIDEIQIELAPILLGDGIGLFTKLENMPLELAITRVIEGTGVTHITYRVVK